MAKMKYYQFNPHSLKYEETPKGNKILSSLVIFFITFSFTPRNQKTRSFYNKPCCFNWDFILH